MAINERLRSVETVMSCHTEEAQDHLHHEPVALRYRMHSPICLLPRIQRLLNSPERQRSQEAFCGSSSFFQNRSSLVARDKRLLAKMASVVVSSAVVTPVAGIASSSVRTSEIISVNAGLKSSVFGGKSEWQSKTQTNGSRHSCMLVWEPYNNKRFETLSYLPPLSQDSLAKQIDYLITNNWHPCIEFDTSEAVTRVNSNMPGYYDGRYWTMWKLPMFGCTDPSQVLREIAECKAKYGDKCYIRVLGFDNTRQVQCAMFIVHKPGQA